MNVIHGCPVVAIRLDRGFSGAINHGHRVKPGRSLKQGDCLSIRRGDEEYVVAVRDLGDRRVSATLAQEKFTEDPQSKARREAAAAQRKLEYEAKAQRQRRPDKRQRRQIIRFTRDD